MQQILRDRVLIKRIKRENSNSILSIVEDENGPLNGEVILIGKSVEDVKIGDAVLYKESDSLPINLDGKAFYILREFDIIGIL